MRSLIDRLLGNALRSQSMVILVILGLVLVVTPLLIAIIGGAVHVDRMEKRTQQLVRQSVVVVRNSEALTSQLLSMERIARRYYTVGDAELVVMYEETHERLVGLIDQLEDAGIPAAARESLVDLRMHASEVVTVVLEAPPHSVELAGALYAFPGMRYSARNVAMNIEMSIDRELVRLEEEAGQARQFLFWLSAALVPIALIVGGIFAWLILRPIRRLSAAVRSLRGVDLPAPIAVGGPPEIRALGVELERLRVRLARSEAEKNRFLRHMSHELKTPLAAIREGTELLADGSVRPDTDAFREIVDILRSSSLELLQLIENLLVLSARDLAHITETIELDRLLDEVLARHRLALNRGGLHVERDVGSLQFEGFRPLVHAALSNLVGNAIRYSPEGGTLHVRAGRRGGWIILDVADEGPGIPADERPHVFEPFYQGRTRVRSPVRGTGVGLSVARDCARAHDGTAEVVEGEFPGAHIRLRLRARQRMRGMP